MHSRHGHFSDWFLKIDVFHPLIESGASSHISGAQDERLSLPNWNVKFLFRLRIDAFLWLWPLLLNKYNKFIISGDILLLVLAFQFKFWFQIKGQYENWSTVELLVINSRSKVFMYSKTRVRACNFFQQFPCTNNA